MPFVTIPLAISFAPSVIWKVPSMASWVVSLMIPEKKHYRNQVYLLTLSRQNLARVRQIGYLIYIYKASVECMNEGCLSHKCKILIEMLCIQFVHTVTCFGQRSC